MDKLDTLEGVLSGAALAAAAGFAREGDETQRRVRIAMDDSSRALREIEALQSRGEVVRAQMPVVMDFDAGLSIAHLTSPAPQLTPSSAGVVRPDLAANMSAAIADLKWPPKPGQYDERGNITAIGELTALASALTYEELRAFLLGLVQSKPPTAAQKIQICFAANGLTTALYGLNLTGEQYAKAWQTFFLAFSSIRSDTEASLFGTDKGTSEDDPHDLVTSPPVASVIDPGITSVVPLGLPNVQGHQYAHQNTDKVSKWRVTVGRGVSAGSTAFQVAFGTSPWVKNGKPYQPVVLSASPLFVVSDVTSNGFIVKAVRKLGANATLDGGFAVYGG